MKVSKKRTAIATELRNAAHVILERWGYAAQTMSNGRPLLHHEARLLGCTLRQRSLSADREVLNVSSDSVNYMNVHWGKSGGVYATRFVPGPWEQMIRDMATTIDPNWPKWAGLCFIDFEALMVTEEDIARHTRLAEEDFARHFPLMDIFGEPAPS